MNNGLHRPQWQPMKAGYVAMRVLLLRSAAGANLALTRLDDRLIGHTWILRA
jgi:hypothetical protein